MNAQRRSPARPCHETSATSRRSPAMDFTGYRHSAATRPTTVMTASIEQKAPLPVIRVSSVADNSVAAPLDGVRVSHSTGCRQAASAALLPPRSWWQPLAGTDSVRDMPGPNREQTEHWNSAAGGGHWVRNQARHDRMLEPFLAMILGGAAITSGERVLDVGCGCG